MLSNPPSLLIVFDPSTLSPHLPFRALHSFPGYPPPPFPLSISPYSSTSFPLLPTHHSFLNHHPPPFPSLQSVVLSSRGILLNSNDRWPGPSRFLIRLPDGFLSSHPFLPPAFIFLLSLLLLLLLFLLPFCSSQLFFLT